MAIKAHLVPIAQINLSHETQARTKIDTDHVADLVQAVKAGAVLSPVELFSDGQTYWIGDGYHRVEAAVKRKAKSIRARVHSGGKNAAILHAAGANTAHGLKPTPTDKRRAIRMALAVAPDWADNRIAKHCGVSNHLVAEVREEVRLENSNVGRLENSNLDAADDSAKGDSGEVRFGRDGKKYPAKKKSGKKKKPADDSEQDAGNLVNFPETAFDGKTIPREEPDSMYTVAGELTVIAKEIRGIQANLRKVLRVIKHDDGSLEVTRPWCGRISVTILAQVLSCARSIEGDIPVGGESDHPYTAKDSKTDEQLERSRM